MGLWILIVIWSLCWKGAALWRAARAGQMPWFVAFLLVHTVGLLEIAYLLFFAPRPGASPGEPAAPWREGPPGTPHPAAGPSSPSGEDGGFRARP